MMLIHLIVRLCSSTIKHYLIYLLIVVGQPAWQGILNPSTLCCTCCKASLSVTQDKGFDYMYMVIP